MLGEIDYTLGSPGDRQWKSAIIIQGPYGVHTPRVIKEFSERNRDDTLIIVVTYHVSGPCDGSFLTEYERNLVSQGRVFWIFIKEPCRIRYREFWDTNYWNQNLQRYTSYMGLQYAHLLQIETCLKIRSDAFLGKENVCKYLFDKFTSKYPAAEALKGRMVISEHTKFQDPGQVNDPHHIADYWMFGYTSDLIRFFNLHSMSAIRTDMIPETNITQVWMRDLGIPLSTSLEDLLRRYFAIACSIEVQFLWLQKWPTMEIYLRDGVRYVTHEQWLKILDRKVETFDVAVVIQGPYMEGKTNTVIQSFFRLNQDVNLVVICSTYLSEHKLTDFEEQKVKGGSLKFIFNEDPQDEMFWQTNIYNQNLQRLSSYNGVKAADDLGVKFCLKMRTDMFFGRKNSLSFLISELNKYPRTPMGTARMIVTSQHTITKPTAWAPFWIRDHWQFSETKVLLDFFNITPSSSWNNGAGIPRQWIYSPETCFTMIWMTDKGINAKTTEELLWKYYIVEDATEMEQVWLKTTDLERYDVEGKNYLEKVFKDEICTTKKQWLELLDDQVSSNR